VDAFVGDVEVSDAGLILGRTLTVDVAGSPSLTSCFCWATVMGDLMSRYCQYRKWLQLTICLSMNTGFWPLSFSFWNSSNGFSS
jgi:hypothetical protein